MCDREIDCCFDPVNGHYQTEAEYMTVYCEEVEKTDGIIHSVFTDDQIQIYGPRQEELAKAIVEFLNNKERTLINLLRR